MKFDKYTRKARVYPAVITLLPFLIFTLNCKIDGLEKIFNNLLGVKILSQISVSLVLLYLLTQINRFVGKFLFEKKLFNEELDLPTTLYLLPLNQEFSEQYKNKIREKVKKDFCMDLPTGEDELKDILIAKRRAAEVVGLIRQKVKDGRLLLQHNIEYGFARNLIGGAIIALFVAIFDVVFFSLNNDKLVISLSIIITIFFSLILLMCKGIINHLAHQYAKRLFQEYLEHA
jgi:hypothetical protein